MKKLPNKLGHFNFLAFLIRSWNFDLEHGGGAIFSQWSGGVKRGGGDSFWCVLGPEPPA